MILGALDVDYKLMGTINKPSANNSQTRNI